MQDGSSGLDELRARLTGLSKILGTAAFEDDQGSFSHCSRPICNSHTTRDVALSHSDSPGKPCTARSRGKSREGQQLTSPPFRSHIASSKSVLRSTNQGQNNSMGFTYAGFKEQEAKWLSQKGELQMMHNKEKKKRLHVESELKRVQVHFVHYFLHTNVLNALLSEDMTAIYRRCINIELGRLST